VAELNHELRNEDLGARIRAVRELAGVEQRELARAAGLSRRELQNAERGLKRLSPDKLKAVADVFGVDPDVLVGVGFDGELKRAAVKHQRETIATSPQTDGWGERPATSEAPPALPVNLPNTERRKDFATRNRIEASWREVRSEMGEALTSCARLISAGSGDDVRRLIDRLERDLTELKTRRAFLRKLADHENALEHVRRPQPQPQPTDAAPATSPSQSIVS
jgi:transcriptional regulator with XRE-family HTH domain